jgi:hypothetical protein
MLMKLNCRQAKDAVMARRKAKLEEIALSYNDEAVLAKISDDIMTAIRNGEEYIGIELGTDLKPTLDKPTIELIKT